MATKQEEIERLVEKYISLAYWYEGEKNLVPSLTKGLLRRLNSLDVVVKARRELPVVSWSASPDSTPSVEFKVAEGFREAYKNAGFEATESLIKEEK